MKKCFLSTFHPFSDGVLVAFGRPVRMVTCKVRRVAFNIRFCLAVGFALDRVGQTACRIWQRDYVGLLNLITRFVEFDRVIKFE
jgi:hypothetical protein